MIEIKAVPEINSYLTYQVLNYLRITGFKLGMLLNFHSLLFKDGVKRIVIHL
ncbi:GxxExxY protein [Chryseobacterium sp. MP_3.2]|nr:GxxExxY protein [Chryseobacterium sp. MP_3.2]